MRFLLFILLFNGCCCVKEPIQEKEKHHVITEDGVNWYSTEEIEEPEYIE